MTDERPSEVLGGLPHTRPHRRSQKRSAPPSGDADRVTTTGPARPHASTRAAGSAVKAIASARAATPAAAPGATKRATRSAARVRRPAQPPGAPPAPRARRPTPTAGVDLVGSAVHVTAELAEIGISAGARALRGVVARLPRP